MVVHFQMHHTKQRWFSSKLPWEKAAGKTPSFRCGNIPVSPHCTCGARWELPPGLHSPKRPLHLSTKVSRPLDVTVDNRLTNYTRKREYMPFGSSAGGCSLTKQSSCQVLLHRNDHSVFKRTIPTLCSKQSGTLASVSSNSLEWGRKSCPESAFQRAKIRSILCCPSISPSAVQVKITDSVGRQLGTPILKHTMYSL